MRTVDGFQAGQGEGGGLYIHRLYRIELETKVIRRFTKISPEKACSSVLQQPVAKAMNTETAKRRS